LTTRDFSLVYEFLIAEGFKEHQMVEFISHEEDYASINEQDRAQRGLKTEDPSPCLFIYTIYFVSTILIYFLS
jgi:hypothetical protein